MTRWIFRLFVIGILGFVGYLAFLSYQKGYFNMPDMPEGSYAFSYRSGFRGIVLDPEVSKPLDDNPKFFRRINFANPDRLYLGLPLEVAPWFEDAWSTCTAPSEEERLEVDRSMPEELRKNFRNARLDAICRIEVDGQKLWRGLLYSVPKV